jgi:hypothetical protein
MLFLSLVILLQWDASTASLGVTGEEYRVYQAPLSADGTCGAFVKIASIVGLNVSLPDTPAMENSCFAVSFFDGSDEGPLSDPPAIPVPVEAVLPDAPTDVKVIVQ